MRIDASKMNIEERVMLELHDLYRKYGYSRFRLGRFEEYELYRRNKDFIDTEDIIVFSDLNGKLVALKPDLTLSIIKNFRYEPGAVNKVFYSENIYRIFKNSRTMREINQTGLECMGDIDLYQVSEVTMLAIRSLRSISPEFVLDLSHMGVIADIMEPLDDATRGALLKCLGEKNAHELRRTGEEAGVSEEILRSLETLISTYGSWREVRKKLEDLPLGEKGQSALEELSSLMGILSENRMASKVRIDFSIVNDMSYYSGLLFKGFIKDLPKSILSGGRYDNLMAKNGKQGGALGFGVYLDDLEGLNADEARYDADVALIYGDEEPAEQVCRAVKELTAGGESVVALKRIPENLRYRRVARLNRGEVENVE